MHRRTIIMSGRLRRVQSFVSLELSPASDGEKALRQAVAPPGASSPNKDWRRLNTFAPAYPADFAPRERFDFNAFGPALYGFSGADHAAVIN